MVRARSWACLMAGVVCTWAAPADAVTTPSELRGRPALEVADGSSVRTFRPLRWYRAPRHAEAGWRSLRAEMGASAHAVWDADTGVVFRIWGEGIAAPSSNASADAAAKHARGLLARHIGLLAPGSSENDLSLVSNVSSGGVRTVAFFQHAGSARVLGGQLSFRYRSDRLFMIASEALPHARMHAEASPNAALGALAEAWIADTALGVASGVDGPFVLPLIAPLRYRSVYRVTVDTKRPRGRWHVYLDAMTGDRVAREQQLRFADGTLHFNAPERWQASTRLDYPAHDAILVADGVTATTDYDGVLSWPTSVATALDVAAEGVFVTVNNDAGANASAALSLMPGGSVVWNESATPEIDAQLSVFVHVNRVIAFARNLDPSLPYFGEVVPANVNINDICNAFYDPQDGSLNFFLAGNGCNNTGLVVDVTYHEYGHALHDNAIIPGAGDYDSALGEGLADYLACTVTDDSAMGRGWNFNDDPLREIDPPNKEHYWPGDIAEAHHFGLIISGALWDLRKLLIAKHGKAPGTAIADALYYEAQRRAVDIPSMYFEVLAADDDNGNLADGTPNICEINQAFGAHGLRRVEAQLTDPAVVAPSNDDTVISLEVIDGLHASCGDAVEAKLYWQLRTQPNVSGVVSMTPNGGAFTAAIPPQPDGSVVQYRVEIDPGAGFPIALPDNPADRFYEMFVGEVEPIYCTDFESDPNLEGWTHGVTMGNASGDDWQWGAPEPKPGSGDPDGALSGSAVWGNDLGTGNQNGKYRPNVTSFSASPPIDVSGYDHVRLQYRRWLFVEDGWFDQATLYANGFPLWSNFDSNLDIDSAVHHHDKEWRFHDVDIDSSVQGGSVTITHELAADQGLNFGGWNLEDWCVVAWIPTACGDGVRNVDEQCDDGVANSDIEGDACRSDCTLPACGDGVIDSGEACDGGAGCLPTCQLFDDGDGGSAPNERDDVRVEQGCACTLPGAPARPRLAPLSWLALALLLRRRRW